jgi:hypothetical protein
VPFNDVQTACTNTYCMTYKSLCFLKIDLLSVFQLE